MFGNAIFDERTERTDWPSSQRNVNEDQLGTQVKQQLQIGTVCAVRVSCCEFGLIIFQNCRTASTAVGLFVPCTRHSCLEAGITLAYDKIYQNYFFKPDRAPGLIDNILIQTIHLLTLAGVNPQFIKHDLSHRP